LENVWSYRNFESFKHILEALEFFGYQVDYWHLNAADFGVPQTRSRLMLVALQDVQPNRPQESAERQSWYSALSPILPEDFETAYPGHGQEPVIDSVKSRHNVSFQIPQITFGARAGAVVRFQDEPSVTLLASKIDRIRFWIQEQHRLVRPTGRVAARLQGFPDTFKLPVDQKLAFHTIGNSVCPPVLTAVIKAQGY
jgi:DNA (cytosine-5)-methyltransferase 1